MIDGTDTHTKFDLTKLDIGEGNSITIKPAIGIAKPRKITHLLGLNGGVEFGVHNQNFDNTLRGLVERVFVNSDGLTPPRVNASKLYKLNNFFMHFVNRSSRTAKITEPEFLTYYSGRRLNVYQRAVESLEILPLTKKDACIKLFVKAEKINFETKVDPAPRVIQPRSPRFNVELGLYLKHLEPRLYKIVKKIFGEHTIFKGFNALQAGKCMESKWNKYKCPVAVGLDASRFDQHVRVELLEYEHAIYKLFYPGDVHLAWLLRMQLVNKGVAYNNDGNLSYQVLGSRMSGDMNTALGNCIIMCALVYTYMNELGVPFSLANNGDDCVLIFESEHLSKIHTLPEWFVDYGLVMKVETPVYELEQIDFCQTSPIWTPEGYIMVRNPINGFDKDMISIDNITTELQWRQSCGLIGECGLHLAGHIPIYNQLYRALAIIGRVNMGKIEMEKCGMYWLARGLDNSNKAVHPQTRASFTLAFGIIPDLQHAVEESIANKSFDYTPGRRGFTNTYNLLNFNLFRDRLV